MTMTIQPTYADVVSARKLVSSYLPPTPLVRSEQLSQALGCEYYIKCENLQPVGAFKVRGGVNLVGRLSDDEKTAGVISASTGNHGQSMAMAGGLFDVPVVIYAPAERVNERKLAAMRDLGAEVRLHGRDFDEARIEVERVAREEGWRYVHSANEPHLIAGVGTMGLEIVDDLPDVDVVIAPVGGGSGVCGLCLAVKETHPSVEVIGVQSEQAPGAWMAWKERQLDVETEAATTSEGLATRVPFEMTMAMMWEVLDDFILVGDDAIDAAVRRLAQNARLVAEGAGAASLAAAFELPRERLAGKKVVGVLSGGNVALTRYAEILSGA